MQMAVPDGVSDEAAAQFWANPLTGMQSAFYPYLRPCWNLISPRSIVKRFRETVKQRVALLVCSFCWRASLEQQLPHGMVCLMQHWGSWRMLQYHRGSTFCRLALFCLPLTK